MSHVFARDGGWLFSRRVDLAAFGGSALIAWLLVALGAALGMLAHDAPDGLWIACVVAVDVAHVWSTGFRVYFDAAEVRSRPLLYLGLPALAYLAGVAVHAVSAAAFWRVLAYVAVFHFMRQQAGFMALYARRDPQHTRLDTLVDRAAIHASMLFPLVHWHASLPRRFAWMVPGDFVEGLSRVLVWPAAITCVGAITAFALRQVVRAQRGAFSPGKSVLLAATAASWVGGIVLFDSDYVFTVTNVLLHGVPYFVLTYRYARAARAPSLAGRLARRGAPAFLGACVTLALAEELWWDRLVWHERPYLFGEHGALSAYALVFVVPLLAVPQATHYLLDGFVWRVRSENPVLRRELE
ncbi:MAG: hypothetical protein ABW252_18070 [Polyangiales bacterium]